MRRDIQRNGAIWRWDNERGELVLSIGACQHRIGGNDLVGLLREVYAHQDEVMKAARGNDQGELPDWARDYRLRRAIEGEE